MTKATKGSDTLTFAYNADGLRTSKTVNGVVHNYYYADGKLVRETYGDTVLDFFYDASGYPYIMKMGNNIYYYITNAQGDVIRLTDIHGNTAAYYQYDPYGKVIHASGSHANINPLKYRAYLHDTETGLYYLQSRYYDPEIGRFINADTMASTGQGLSGNNMFAYCNNNPVNACDPTGKWSEWLTVALGVVLAAAAIAVTVATLGAAAPAAACALTMMGTSIGVSYTVASTAATVAVAATVTVAATYAGDAAYSSVTGYSPLKETVFQGNEEAYNAGATVANIATMGMMSAAAYSPGICFIAGTLIKTETSDIPIEEIVVGDVVWAWDEESGMILPKEVVETYVNETTNLVHVFLRGEEIISTPEHPFYSPVKGWTAACKLRAGDILVTVNGEYVVVEKIQHEMLENPILVYNFQVKDCHTYFVSGLGILVHNRCENHHIISNKNKTYTPKFKAITDQFGLNLNDDWNIIALDNHHGRHTNNYHQYILDSITEIAGRSSNQQAFLKGFSIIVDALRNDNRLPYR